MISEFKQSMAIKLPMTSPKLAKALPKSNKQVQIEKPESVSDEIESYDALCKDKSYIELLKELQSLVKERQELDKEAIENLKTLRDALSTSSKNIGEIKDRIDQWK